jgi:quinolinate synthase
MPILFSPDKNLGGYVRAKTGREMLLWQGVCTVHEAFSEARISALIAEHPDAELIAHPECEASVLRHAGFVGSTSALLRYVQEGPVRSYIVATEAGILHQMRKAAPENEYIPAPPENGCLCNVCDYMKVHTLRKLHQCMLHRSPAVRVAEDIRSRALRPIQRMIELHDADAHRAAAILAEIELPFQG